MRALLNTLFVTSEDIYLALDGDNITIETDGEILEKNCAPVICATTGQLSG